MTINDEKELLDLNSENVLRFITHEDIYKMYLHKDFKFNVLFSSPFRLDKRPSFIIGGKERGFRYKDFATGDKGNSFNFVMSLYNINYNEALIQIVSDFNIKHNFIMAGDITLRSKIVANYDNPGKTLDIGEVKLGIKIRKYEQYDFDYWNVYGISAPTLRLGNIFAISHYFINDIPVYAEKLAYAYVENKDGKITYKVYQPLSKYRKWINNNNYSVWELWNLLPDSGDKLIITSSRKDALAIIENLKIPAISFQAESVMPKESVMNDVLSRFKTVYLLYDNDYDKAENWGQKLALKLLNKYPSLVNIIIEEKFKSKDYSDLVKNTGRTYSKKVLTEILTKK